MSYKKIGEFQNNDENPFMPDTLLHIERGEKTLLMGHKTPEIIIDTATGLQTGQSVFLRTRKIDKAQFAKIYINSLSSFFGLSKSGMKLFGYIVSIVKPNKDDFFFDMNACLKYTEYDSRKTILNALSELIENKFIARGKNSYHYYINPTIFFNGDRIAFIDQYFVEDKEFKKAKIKS